MFKLNFRNPVLEALSGFYDLLTRYDYVIGKVYPKTVEFRNYKFRHENFSVPNFLAVKKQEKELIRSAGGKLF